MRGFFTAFVRNRVFSNIVLLIIFLGGAIATMQMSRETFPDIPMDLITVLVTWPGADPEEVEEGVSSKIEEALEGVEGIERVNTISGENFGIARIEVDEHAPMDVVKDRVRNRVEAISNFPEDADRPIIEEVIQKVQVLFIALYSDVATERDLKEWGTHLVDEVRMLPSVSQVELLGDRPYEISIELSEEKLRQFGLSFDQVAQIVRANSLNVPGGVMHTEGEDIRLRTLGRKYTAKDYASLIVIPQANGEHVTLDRIATIKDAFIQENVISQFNGKRAVTIAVLKTEEEDTLTIDQEVRDFVAKKKQELPDSVTLETWGHMAPLLQKRINLLARNGLIGLVLVFIMLWLFLDFRLSFWVGMGMPVSVAGAALILWWWGATINMITLFGLITVLGIIVDDAIVVGEAIYVARKNGAPPIKAAIDGVTEVGMPVVAAVTTTIVAFIPLLYVSGFLGKIVQILPIVVIACLLISLIECLILLPAHLNHLPDFNRETQRDHILARIGKRFHHFTNHGLEWFVEHLYQPFVALALRWRYVSFCVAVSIVLVTWGMWDSGVLKFEFFPTIDGNAMSCVLELPNGTPVTRTREAVARIENAIKQMDAEIKTESGGPLLRNIFSTSGAKIDERGGRELGSHFGTVRVELLDSSLRGIHTDNLMHAWEEYIGKIPGVVALTFRGDEVAPPGRPVEVWLTGNDMEYLVAASRELKEHLANYVGVYQIQDDYREGKKEIRIRLKPEGRMLGINVADVARQIHAGYYGQEAIRLQRDREDLRVRVRYPEDERNTIADFENLRIRVPASPGLPGMGGMGGMAGLGGGMPGMGMGAAPGAAGKPYREIPLMSVADIEYGMGFSSINRTDGQRRVVVTAEVNAERANANEVVEDLRETFFPGLQRKYPSVGMEFHGEQEDIRKGMGALFIGFPLALVGIYIIIATIFRSYVQPLVIMVTVPFGMCGAFFGHLLLGFDISMMSVFGCVALAGVVVNDAIVLIECVNNFLARGEDFADAVRLGGARRFRPILLTTITTVGGLTPLIMETDYQAQMLIPMAVALAGGVAFATLLTLLLVPCLLGVLNDFRRTFRWLILGTWPTPEEVEPATKRLVDEPDLTPAEVAP